MPPSPLSWTVTIDFVSEGEVELAAYLNGEDRRSGSDRCSLQEALRQLEVLFACTGDAVFSRAVRAPQGDWRHLSTTRWRSALFFVTAQYERAFVGHPELSSSRAEPHHEPARSSDSLENEPDAKPAFVAETGVVPVLSEVAAAVPGAED